VAFVLREGLMEYCTANPSQPGLRLTLWGERCINGVIALFYAPAVQSHLLALAAEAQPGRNPRSAGVPHPNRIRVLETPKPILNGF
jgi:hypothetical protein